MGHLTFVPKRLSAVGNKRISQFFDSASEPRSRVIALVDSTWVFLLLSFYIVLLWNMPLFKVWSEDKLNKKFVVAENFAELAHLLNQRIAKSFCFRPLTDVLTRKSNAPPGGPHFGSNSPLYGA